MNVLYIATYAGLSGASYSLLSLAEEIRQIGAKPYVVLLNEGKLQGELEKRAIPYFVVRAYPWVIDSKKKNRVNQKMLWLIKQVYNVWAERQIVSIIKEKQIHILHINALTASVGLRASQKCNIPCIWHIREFVEEDLGKSFWNKKRAMRLLGKATKVIAISNSVKEKFSIISKRKDIEVVYNGIPSEQYKKERSSVILSNQVITVILAGRIDPGKGHKEVLNALIKIEPSDRNKIKLKIVGVSQNKCFEENIKQYVNKNGLSDIVEFLGFRNDMPELYRQADISIVASRAEAFGRVTVEAMLGGTLVIGADTAATKELIGEEFGLLYKQGDANDLADKLRYAIRHKNYMREIANHAHDFAKQKFTARRNADEIYGIYQKIQEKKGNYDESWYSDLS